MKKTVKINFKELNLTSLSGEVKEMDTREAIGELIYSGTNGIGYKLLAGDFFTNKLTDAIREHVK